jgi:hypothetical protein
MEGFYYYVPGTPEYYFVENEKWAMRRRWRSLSSQKSANIAMKE